METEQLIQPVAASLNVEPVSYTHLAYAATLSLGKS